MNSTGNSSSFQRIALGNLSNTNPTGGYLVGSKPALSNFTNSSLKYTFGETSTFSKDTPKFSVNTASAHDPENFHPKLSVSSQGAKYDSDFSNKGSFLTLPNSQGNTESLRSPDFQKSKKVFGLQSITPQEKINDQMRHEKRRLSQSLPQEEKFGASYILNENALIDEDYHTKIKSLQKKINFAQEFLSFDSHHPLDNSSNSFQMQNIYEDFDVNPAFIEDQLICENQDRTEQKMVDNFLEKDLNNFEFCCEENIFL